MKKVIILIFTIVVLSGCSVSYELDINKNLIVKENVYFIEDNSKLLQYGTNLKTAVNNISSFYFSTKNNLEPQILITNPSELKSTSNSTLTSLNLNKTYNNMKLYNTSLFLNSFFEDSQVTEDDKYITIYGAGFNWDKIKSLTEDNQYKFDFDTLNIKINLPFKIEAENADIHEDNSKEYIWVFNEGNYKSKILKIKFEKDGVSSKDSNLDKIGGNIIDLITGGKINGKELFKKYKPAIIFIIIIIVCGIIAMIVNKKKKKNDKI